jgi:PAS domain S-box-containing protein
VTDLPRSIAPLLEEDATDLYENAPCGYVSMAGDGTLLRVNATFEAMTGHSRDWLLAGRRFQDLLTIGGRIFIETHLRPLLRLQGFAREIALDLQLPGRVLPVLLNAVERRSAPDADYVVRMTIFDASDRRRYERDLLDARNAAERAAAARSDLIAMVSHDVRAPLSAIQTAAHMLAQTEMSPQQSRYARILNSSAAHALTLLNSILDLSSLEGGHVHLRQREFDLHQLVEAVAGTARLAAAGRPAVAVVSTVDPATPRMVVGDREKIAQVLSNLLTNAVKFTHEGQVSLMVYARERRGDRAAIEFIVSDTGIGIPEDRLHAVFNEFTQASEEIGEKYGGTGLGLAICRKLLALHGSQLHLTSTVGQGSTFSFVLELGIGGVDG